MASGGGTWHTVKSGAYARTRFFAKSGESRRHALNRKKAYLDRGRAADYNYGLV